MRAHTRARTRTRTPRDEVATRGVRACVRVRACVCACVCVCVRACVRVGLLYVPVRPVRADLGTGGPLGPASMGREAAGRRRRLQGSGSGSRVERPLQGAVSRELRGEEHWDERCAASASGGKESVPPRGTGRRGSGAPGRGGPEKPWGAARAGKALRACLLGRFPTLPPRSRAGRLAGAQPAALPGARRSVGSPGAQRPRRGLCPGRPGRRRPPTPRRPAAGHLLGPRRMQAESIQAVWSRMCTHGAPADSGPGRCGPVWVV
jgi:hypothetical protein